MYTKAKEYARTKGWTEPSKVVKHQLKDITLEKLENWVKKEETKSQFDYTFDMLIKYPSYEISQEILRDASSGDPPKYIFRSKRPEKQLVELRNLILAKQRQSIETFEKAKAGFEIELEKAEQAKIKALNDAINTLSSRRANLNQEWSSLDSEFKKLGFSLGCPEGCSPVLGESGDSGNPLSQYILNMKDGGCQQRKNPLELFMLAKLLKDKKFGARRRSEIRRSKRRRVNSKRRRKTRVKKRRSRSRRKRKSVRRKSVRKRRSVRRSVRKRKSRKRSVRKSKNKFGFKVYQPGTYVTKFFNDISTGRIPYGVSNGPYAYQQLSTF